MLPKWWLYPVNFTELIFEEIRRVVLNGTVKLTGRIFLVTSRHTINNRFYSVSSRSKRADCHRSVNTVPSNMPVAVVCLSADGESANPIKQTRRVSLWRRPMTTVASLS